MPATHDAVPLRRVSQWHCDTRRLIRRVTLYAARCITNQRHGRVSRYYAARCITNQRHGRRPADRWNGIFTCSFTTTGLARHARVTHDARRAILMLQGGISTLLMCSFIVGSSDHRRIVDVTHHIYDRQLSVKRSAQLQYNCNNICDARHSRHICPWNWNILIVT